MNQPLTALDYACRYLGWKGGGTIHGAKAALEEKEDALIRKFNTTEGQTEEESNAALKEIATVQYLLSVLPY
jgi:hypothetical protein